MSVNDLAQEIEDMARRAVLESKAIRICPFHGDAVVWNGDPDADKLAYAIATKELKKSDTMFLRGDVMDAVKHEIDMADAQCNQCDAHRED